MTDIYFRDLGPKRYKPTWDIQEELFNGTVQQKIANRKAGLPENHGTRNYLLFVEHPHVFTLGKSGSLDNLLVSQDALQQKGIDFFKNNRGGDITYHGPGQIVGYPILDLEHFFTDIHQYMRTLEQTIIDVLAEFDIEGQRLKDATGVWLDASIPGKARKICAMGVRTSRWVTMHGFAFNINTDLSLFNYIIPCGITDKTVTSLEKELGAPQDIAAIKERVKHHFAANFKARFTTFPEEATLQQ